MGEYHCQDLVDHFSQLFSRFAVKGKLEHENKHGVDVKWSKKTPGNVRFEFVTKEDFHIGIDVQLQDVNRQYIDNMMWKLAEELFEAGKNRYEKNKIIIMPEASDIDAVANQKPMNRLIKDQLNPGLSH